MVSPIRKMFDGIAHRYDFLNHALSLFRDVAWRKASCRMLRNKAPSLVNLLDLCGGTGDFAKTYAQELGMPKCSVIGDFSYGMLYRSVLKSKESFTVQMDALKTPFPGALFDVILNGFGMRNLPDASLGLDEVKRILKPGGYFVTLEFFAPSNWFSRFFYNVLAPIFIPIVGAFFSGKKEAYEYLVRSVRGFLTVENYVLLAQQKGFEVEEVKACDFGIAYRVLIKKKEERL